MLLKIEELYQEFFITSMVKYLDENSLAEEMFLNQDGFFIMKKYFSGENHNHVKSLKRFDPILYTDISNYLNFECDISENLLEVKDIDFAFNHYLKATENLFENFIKYIKEIDKENENQDLYKQLLNMDFKKNITPVYWMLKKNTYKDFLKERQQNSRNGYDDYLCHTLFKDTSLTERIFHMEMMENNSNYNGVLVQRLFKNLISESEKINSYNNDNKIAKKMMSIFIAYEFIHEITSSYAPKIMLKNFIKIFDNIFKMENRLIRNENQIILYIDKKIFLEKNSSQNNLDLITKGLSLDDNCALLIIEDGDILEGYKQKLSTCRSFTFEINPEMENKSIYMDALEEELELIKLEKFSSLEKFIEVDLKNSDENYLNKRVRARYLGKILSQKEKTEKVKRKI